MLVLQVPARMSIYVSTIMPAHVRAASKHAHTQIRCPYAMVGQMGPPGSEPAVAELVGRLPSEIVAQ